VAGVVVVGGGSGIGRACAELLVERGWRVAVLDLRVPEVALEGVEAVLEVDVRNADAVEEALTDTEAQIGELTGAVHAAGTARVTPLLEITRKEWDLIVGVNLTGAWNVLSAVARRFAARGGGVFVAVSSVDAQRPVAGLAHYCASKAGLESLVRVAALELGAAGIRVNAVAPGVVETPLMEAVLSEPAVRADFLEHIPLGRVAEPLEIASVVAFLLSDDAGYVTGQTLIADGGMALREHPHLPLPRNHVGQEH
jgi:NAD(P)-dependent dehydrogenase (short-subunit alcohol dehydrogenase family)